jgi:hypothetical protein
VISRFTRALCVAAFFACTTSGCVHYASLGTSYSGPAPLPRDVAARYAYAPPPVHPETGPVKRRRHFVVRDVELKPVKPDGAADTLAKTIELEYYDVDAPEPTPVILLPPILNGHLLVTHYFARYFAEQGWAAVVVKRDREPIPIALGHVEQTMRRNLLDYRRVLDWVSSEPEFDQKRIGVFGISFGGIDAVVLAALDKRVDAVVAGMAGGDLAYLFVNTSYRSVARQVARRLRHSGLSRETLEKDLDAQLDTEPMRLAPYVDAEDLLMIMTRTDRIIPFEAQQALRRRLGRPRALILPTGHRTSVVYFPLIRRTAYEFLANRFRSAAGSAASAEQTADVH